MTFSSTNFHTGFTGHLPRLPVQFTLSTQDNTTRTTLLLLLDATHLRTVTEQVFLLLSLIKGYFYALTLRLETFLLYISLYQPAEAGKERFQHAFCGYKLQRLRRFRKLSAAKCNKTKPKSCDQYLKRIR